MVRETLELVIGVEGMVGCKVKSACYTGHDVLSVVISTFFALVSNEVMVI